MENFRIVRVVDFAKIPGARYRTDGDNSAEEFFEDVLKPIADQELLNGTRSILLDLDYTTGYASSFVSELAMRMYKDYHKVRKIRKRILIKSDEDPGQIENFWDGFKEEQKS